MKAVLFAGTGAALLLAGAAIPVYGWLTGLTFDGDAKAAQVMLQLAGFALLLGAGVMGRAGAQAAGMIVGAGILAAAFALPLCALALGAQMSGEDKALFVWLQMLSVCLCCWTAGAARSAPGWAWKCVQGCSLALIAAAAGCFLARDSEIAALLVWGAILGALAAAAGFGCEIERRPAPVPVRCRG